MSPNRFDHLFGDLVESGVANWTKIIMAVTPRWETWYILHDHLLQAHKTMLKGFTQMAEKQQAILKSIEKRGKQGDGKQRTRAKERTRATAPKRVQATASRRVQATAPKKAT